MNRRVIVLDEAEDELVEAQEWYETQRRGLGEEFRGAIDEAMGSFHEVPLTASPTSNKAVAGSPHATRLLSR